MITRAACIAISMAALNACAGMPEAAAPPGANPTHRLQRLADPNTGIDQLLLVPLATTTMAADDAPMVSRVEVGALFATFAKPGREPVQGVALIVKAVSPSAEPLFAWTRKLDLEVNGVVLEGNPRPDPRLYHVGRIPTGVVETFIVPVKPELIRAMAGASEVRGEIGRRLRFEMNPAHQAGFAAFLDELPATVRRGIKAETAAVVAAIAAD